MFPGITTKISESTVASTTTISPLTDLVRITGSTAIATINPPPNWGGVSAGVMFLVATDGTLGLVTTGNILLAVTMAQNKVTVLVWSASQAKWYPGAIS